MGIASFVIGLLSVLGVCLSFIPGLNLANCITLPIALIGLILGIVGLVQKNTGKTMAIIGLILNVLALIVGIVRVVISCVAGACIL
jgi:hypothetical protein